MKDAPDDHITYTLFLDMYSNGGSTEMYSGIFTLDEVPPPDRFAQELSSDRIFHRWYELNPSELHE